MTRKILIALALFTTAAIIYPQSHDTLSLGWSFSNQVFSNSFVTNQNSISTNQIPVFMVYTFFDPFDPLISIGSYDEFKLHMASLIIPLEELKLYKPFVSRKKHYRGRLGVGLMTSEELLSYSENIFQKWHREKKKTNFRITDEEKKHLAVGFEEWETKVIVSGWVNLKGSYGWTLKNENYLVSVPGIFNGFNLNQNMRINILGKVGERVSVSINHSSDNPDNEYEIAFQAKEDDKGVLRELRAGNISLTVPASSFFVRHAGTSKDSYGLKSVFQFGDLTWQTVLNLTRSQKAYKKFLGRKKLDNIELMDVSYVKRKYYQLPDMDLNTSSVEVYQSVSTSLSYDQLINGKKYKRLFSGRDYILNADTGELTLTNVLDRATDLAVYYTCAAGGITTNQNSITGTDSLGRMYLYLWESTANFSQYLNNGFYQLGVSQFDTSRGFSLQLVYTADKTRLAPVQFTPADYYLYPSTGLIRFKQRFPFPDDTGRVYTNATDPTVADSLYTMQITLYSDIRSYQLDYGIIPGTERIFINSRQLNDSEYTLIHATGELTFKNSTIINDNDAVEIYYEYKPFWSGSQKFGVASRLDYKPNNAVNLGSTLIYSMSQREVQAPSVTATPDGIFMADLDGQINFARAFSLPAELNILLKGEAALSVYDPNTAGYAIIDDFENSSDSYGFSKLENRWLLAAPLTNITGMVQTNRGKLLYKDYRNYQPDGSFTIMNYSFKLPDTAVKDYSFKPGPYTAMGGHLDTAQFTTVNQSSLIFDCDFQNDRNWAGAVMPLGNSSGVDLSVYNQINLWVRLEHWNGSTFVNDGNSQVELILAAGQLPEDSDSDGTLDAELDRSQAGFDFNGWPDTGIVETKVGRGRQGEGDGYIQSEDLNQNSILDLNGNYVVLPGGNSDLTTISVNEGGWQKISLNLRNFNSDQIRALEHATGLGVYVRKSQGDLVRLLIDTLEFKEVNWNTKKVDSVRINESLTVRAEELSVFNSPQYVSDRFYNNNSSDSNVTERARRFEKLHGSKTVSEANQYNEKAMNIVYCLSNTVLNTNSAPATGGTNTALIKQNVKAYDLSRYQYLTFYAYVPSKDESGNPLKTGSDTYQNEVFTIRLANSDHTCYFWEIPMQVLTRDSWHTITLHIRDGMKLSVDSMTPDPALSYQTLGSPNLREINQLELGIALTGMSETENNGQIWINEIHCHSVSGLLGLAWYVNPTLEYKKPIWSLDKLEIIGPLRLDTRMESRDDQFIGSEGTKPGSYNRLAAYNLSTALFRDFSLLFNYSDNSQGTSTNQLDLPLYLQWDYNKNTWNHQIQSVAREWIPAFSHSYTESQEKRLARNLATGTQSDYILAAQDVQFANSIKAGLTENWKPYPDMVFNPRISFEDSFYLLDRSSFSNEMTNDFISNSTIYSMKGRKKNLQAGATFSWATWTLAADSAFYKEKYNRQTTWEGYRQELNKTTSDLLPVRYGERWASFFQGFGFPDDEIYDKQNGESFLLALSSDKPLPFLSFYYSDKLARDAGGFGYDTTNGLQSRTEKFTLNNETRLNFYPKFILADSIQLKLKRDLDLSYNRPAEQLNYTNIFKDYSQIYYYQPFHYSSLFNGINGRTNSLSLAALYREGFWNSSFRLYDGFNLEWILGDMNAYLSSIIPKRYILSSVLTTARNLSTFSQVQESSFETSLPLKISEWGIPFIHNTGDLRWNDIMIGFKLTDTRYYHERREVTAIGGALSQTVWLNRYNNFQFSYNLDFSQEQYLTNVENFETNYGFPLKPPALSPLTKLVHTGRLVYVWTIPKISKLNLLIVEIQESKLNNRESLTLTADQLNYNGVVFNRYTQKVFELAFDHSSEFLMTDYLASTLSLKMVLNQNAEVTPVGDRIQTTFFRPGFGLQLTLDARIRF